MSQITRTIILVPSRGRPERLNRMIISAASLSVGGILVIAGVDKDDPKNDEYQELTKLHRNLLMFSGPRDSLSGWTNMLAGAAIANFGIKGTFLVSMGDDHEVQTDLWDLALINSIHSLDGPGFSFGDDQINGSGLCTSWMVSAEVVDALGWMMLPQCRHMYVDSAIMELGNAADRIKYNPLVTIEHLHPIMQKSEIDQTYLDGTSTIDLDLDAFREWHAGPKFKEDVQKIKELTW